MKKQILLAVLSVLSLSLVGCNKPTSTSTPASASVAPSVSESASVSVPQVGELSFTCNVKPLVGTTGYLIASYEGSPLTDQSLVSYTADPATAIALSGNLVQFKEVGKVTITGSYVPEGFTTAPGLPTMIPPFLWIALAIAPLSPLEKLLLLLPARPMPPNPVR
jgi:hypothetical protein